MGRVTSHRPPRLIKLFRAKGHDPQCSGYRHSCKTMRNQRTLQRKTPVFNPDLLYVQLYPQRLLETIIYFPPFDSQQNQIETVHNGSKKRDQLTSCDDQFYKDWTSYIQRSSYPSFGKGAIPFRRVVTFFLKRHNHQWCSLSYQGAIMTRNNTMHKFT